MHLKAPDRQTAKTAFIEVVIAALKANKNLSIDRQRSRQNLIPENKRFPLTKKMKGKVCVHLFSFSQQNNGMSLNKCISFI